MILKNQGNSISANPHPSGVRSPGGDGVRKAEAVMTALHSAMHALHGSLEQRDPAVATSLAAEMARQSSELQLIASENVVSAAVMEAAGSILTNKVAEGYPGHRYYAGCEFIDQIESLGIERAKALFGVEHANIQPHSGVQANMAVYLAILKPGDTILGMKLAHGGHLSHGHAASFSGKFYNILSYGVRRDDEQIDYDELARVAREHRPQVILIGGSAYPRMLDFARVREHADEVNARVVADIAHIAGLVVAGVHPSPVPFADFVTSSTHKTLRGPHGGLVLCAAKYAKELDKAVFPGAQGSVLMNLVSAKTVCLGEASDPSFAAYQRQAVVNAKRLAAVIADSGFRLVSGGTDTHLMLVDVSTRGLTGKTAQEALASAGLVVNANAIPFDRHPPYVASGIRIGTPVATTRGMGEAEMEFVGERIARVLISPADTGLHKSIRKDIEGLCSKFPLAASLHSRHSQTDS